MTTTPDFKEFQKKLGVEFKDIDVLRQACTHRSYLNENKKSVAGHNERLEFLGDAVLELAITFFLYRKFPDKNEGELTSYRAALVNSNSLALAAQHLDIDRFLLLSRGESKDTGRARAIIHADAFEAIIGAIYVDQGYQTAANFISTHILEVLDIDEIINKKSWLDAKSKFQEIAQEKQGITPMYKLIKDTGPDHNKVFTVGVFLGDVNVGMGSGMSKQEAEQKAAEKALENKGW